MAERDRPLTEDEIREELERGRQQLLAIHEARQRVRAQVLLLQSAAQAYYSTCGLLRRALEEAFPGVQTAQDTSWPRGDQLAFDDPALSEPSEILVAAP